jgi:hypothetical protein
MPQGCAFVRGVGDELRFHVALRFRGCGSKILTLISSDSATPDLVISVN